MDSEPFVAVVIPNYNSASIEYEGEPILYSCLNSLIKTDYSNYKIIIADNMSTDNSAEIVKKFDVDFVVKKTKEEYGGIPRTNNFGIKYALKKYKPDYILMYNTDMLISEALWLKKLVKVADSDKKIGIVGCKLLYHNGIIQHAGMIIDATPRNRGRGEIDHGQYNKIEEFDGVTAALSLIRREVFEKAGFFDENLYSGFDDTDFCIRAKKAGFRIVYDGEVSIIHLEGLASANSTDSAINDKSFYANQISYMYFALKNFDAVNRIKVLFFLLGRSFFSAESNERERKIGNMRLKDRKLWRFETSIKAVFKAYNIYKKSKSS